LQQGVDSGVFPGAVASLGEVTAEGAPRIHACAGLLEPSGSHVALDTPYDLASLTKPFVAIAALRLAQQGLLDLHTPIGHWLPELEGTPGGESSLALLLSHRAGLSSWGNLFQESTAAPGSPAMRAFMLREAAVRTADKDEAGAQSVYSDLGYLLAGEALARASQRDLDEIVRREVTEPLGLAGEVFYAAALSAAPRGRLDQIVAPTELCPERGRIVRGEVHDENCAAFGGIAGHAGLFGTSRAVLEFGLSVLSALHGRSTWLDQALLRWALAPRRGGTHVVGWDTKSDVGSSAGSRFSERAFGHLGFTGTSIWGDPARGFVAVLLSNRVHPTRENGFIRAFRPAFHDAAVDLWFGGE
jgi:CubicO group peptidase (beta-lactamase class C family)